MVENETLEFKREVNDSIVKEVIALANTKGGTIIIGHNDDGSVYGIENVKKEIDKISNKLHDSIEPNIDFLVTLKITKEDNKDIIILEVLQGTNKPYYIKGKGMTSEGVYVRFGATTQPATRDIIREMIVETSGITFEKNISNNQELTFLYAEKIFKEKEIAFGKTEKKNLGIINEKGMYTNLGLLISDQCPYTIKMAIYPDNTKKEFLDRLETSVGSVLQQLEEAEKYLRLNNKVSGKIVGMERVETPEYKIEVLRECLLNTIGHRDYEIPGSTLIHIFKDGIEFLSLGGLVKGLTIEDIKIGSSASRNPKLINIFHRLGLVEAYGSGIPRIMEEYTSAIEKPEITVAPHSFLIKIPKLNYSEEYQIVINYLKNEKYITREDVEKLLGVKRQKALNVLVEMQNMELIIKEGTGKKVLYKLK